MRIIITLRDILGLVGMIATLIFVLVVAIQEKLKNRKKDKRKKRGVNKIWKYIVVAEQTVKR